jgi:hypothetical protein
MSAMDDRTQTPPTPMTFPAGLIVAFLIFQLILLAWSAFPAVTMKAAGPLESWTFLAGGQALFVSWFWPIVGRSHAGWMRGQIVLEAALLAAAGAPACLAAILWTDAPQDTVLAGGAYVLAWLVAGGLAAGGRPAVRWAFGLLSTLANFGLLGLGYLWMDFLNRDPLAMWRFSPICQASRFATAGWSILGGNEDRLAGLLPVAALVVLAAVGLLMPRAKQDHSTTIP